MSNEVRKFINRTSAKELAKLFDVDYGYVYNTWSNNNRGIQSLKGAVLSGFRLDQIENRIIAHISKPKKTTLYGYIWA